MRELFLILCLLAIECSAHTQPPRAADSLDVIRVVDEMLAVRNRDIKKRDSLLSESIRVSSIIGRKDYLLKLYNLWSVLKLQQNEYRLATDLSLTSVNLVVGTPLQESVFFRDAVTQLTLSYTYLGKNDSCIYWAEYGRRLCRQQKDNFNHSVLLTLEAISRMNDWPENRVEKLFDTAISLARTTPSRHDDMMAGYNKAGFLKAAGKKDWVRSIETLTSLQEIIDHPEFSSVKDKPYERVPFWFRGARPSLYRELSQVYFKLSNLGDACYYQEEIVKDYKNTDNYAYLPYVWSDLAEYETFRNNKQKVKHIYDSSSLLIRQYHKKEEIPIPSFYYAGGWLAEQEGDLKAAIKQYSKAIAAAAPGFHLSSLALFRTQIKMGDIEGADQSYTSIRKQLWSNPIFFYQVLFEKELAEYYQARGDEKLAMQSRLQYYELKDSMTTAARFYMINEAETRFKTREKEKELALMNKEKLVREKALQQKTWQVIFLVGGLILLLGSLLLLFRFYRNKRQQAIILKQKNQQIETLIRELHHRVKNNLQVVSSLMSLQSNRIEDDNARQALEEGKTRVDAMAMIHQRLYMDNELAAVDISDYLHNLTISLANSFGYSVENLNTMVELPKKSMEIDQAIPIGLIVNELVTNAFKHAFDGIREPLISVSLREINEKTTELKVSDNGSGMAEHGTLNKSDSFGMKLVYTLVKQLNGELNVIQDKGTIFKINIRA